MRQFRVDETLVWGMIKILITAHVSGKTVFRTTTIVHTIGKFLFITEGGDNCQQAFNIRFFSEKIYREKIF